MDPHDSDVDGTMCHGPDMQSWHPSREPGGRMLISGAPFESRIRPLAHTSIIKSLGSAFGVGSPPAETTAATDEAMSDGDMNDEDSGDGRDGLSTPVKQEAPTPPSKAPASPPVSAAPPPFPLPLAFPFPHPGAAFLPPPTATPASPLSSESSGGSQQHHQSWSFEEQFKQVRQLYELSDDPKRKEFLDDLFSYMQKRGTPINRLPIMAKSVLDLFELYNLVIARGGLVDVINKKLWQEIIKGLHLPSSITSAAFTLRTQYMKYLYPYECEKRRLSTPAELQAAIDGNRREGRRSSYGGYGEMVQRSPVSLASQGQISPLSLVTSRPQGLVNGNANNHHHHHHPHHASPHPAHPTPIPGPLHPGSIPALAPSEFEARMVEYVKLLNRELRTSATTPPQIRQSSASPPSPQEALEMTQRLSLWNIYGNSTPPEPQKEALNLDVRSAQEIKQENEDPGPPPAKRPAPDDDSNHKSSAHIKIASRGDGRTGSDNSLVVSMEINGIMYQGVLFAQNSRTRVS